MRVEAKALGKTIVVLVLATVLVMFGIVIGANISPRVQRAEERARQSHLLRDSQSYSLADLPDVIAVACPSVVSVKSDTKTTAGYLASANGFVVTGLVKSPPSGSITTTLSDGRQFPAHLIGSDDLTGLSLLKVDGESFRYLPIATGGLARSGDLAIALTAPGGNGCVADPSFVSSDSLARAPGPVASILLSRANTTVTIGSPEIGGDGRILAIAATPFSAGVILLPADVIAQSMQLMLRGETSPERLVGMVAEDLSLRGSDGLGAQRQPGAFLLLVRPGSRAGRAGLKAGDLITSVRGSPVASASELGRAIDAARGPFRVSVVRQRTLVSFNVR